jgi:hypothetical protein
MALTVAKTAFTTFCFQFIRPLLLTTAFELIDVTFQAASFEKLHSHAVFQTLVQSMYYYR